MAETGIIATKNWVTSLINKVLKKKVVELTQEHLTGESYNGKPVYEKSYSVSLLPPSSSNTSYVLDANFNYKPISISGGGYQVTGSERWYVPLQYMVEDGSFALYAYVGTDSVQDKGLRIEYRTGGESVGNVIVTIKYIKEPM